MVNEGGGVMLPGREVVETTAVVVCVYFFEDGGVFSVEGTAVVVVETVKG